MAARRRPRPPKLPSSIRVPDWAIKKARQYTDGNSQSSTPPHRLIYEANQKLRDQKYGVHLSNVPELMKIGLYDPPLQLKDPGGTYADSGEVEVPLVAYIANRNADIPITNARLYIQWEPDGDRNRGYWVVSKIAESRPDLDKMMDDLKRYFLVKRLDDYSRADPELPNLRGSLARVRGSEFYREPPSGSLPDEGPSTEELRAWLVKADRDYDRRQKGKPMRNNPRRNPPPPPPRRRSGGRPLPPPRGGGPASILSSVRRMSDEHEKPFDPARSYPRESKRHHFMVNAGEYNPKVLEMLDVMENLNVGDRIRINAVGIKRPRNLYVTEGPIITDRGIDLYVSSGKPWGHGRIRGGRVLYDRRLYGDNVMYQPTALQQITEVTELEQPGMPPRADTQFRMRPNSSRTASQQYADMIVDHLMQDDEVLAEIYLQAPSPSESFRGYLQSYAREGLGMHKSDIVDAGSTVCYIGQSAIRLKAVNAAFDDHISALVRKGKRVAPKLYPEYFEDGELVPELLPNGGDEDKDEIVAGAARAFFVSPWADSYEEAGGSFSQQQIEDEAPETPAEVEGYAQDFIRVVERLNGASIQQLYESHRDLEGHEREPDPHEFGWYLSMQAQGHGVSWYDSHPEPAGGELKLPNAQLYVYVDPDDTEEVTVENFEIDERFA